MTEIILVRHGESDAQAGGRYSGRGDAKLTLRGGRQAAALADWAATADLAAVVASPLSRARDTASAVARTVGVGVQLDDRLVELDFGIAEGLTLDEVDAKEPGTADRFRSDPVTYHLPRGEDPRGAAARARACLSELADRHPGRRVLVVTHNTLIRLVVCDVLGLPLSRYRHSFPGIANCGRSTIAWSGSTAQVLELNVPLHQTEPSLHARPRARGESATVTLAELTDLGRWLGDPARQLVTLAEGNVSARVDDSTAFVKASGRGMATIAADDFVKVRLAPLVELVESDDAMTAEEVDQVLAEAVTSDSPSQDRPSIETFIHAIALHMGARWVGHTHPPHVVGLLSSSTGEELMRARMFPDEAVICGAHSLVVPYANPGLDVARLTRDCLRSHLAAGRGLPAVILLANHGLFALGPTAAAVRAVTEMTGKAATIRIAALAAGNPRLLPEDDVLDLTRRPDEVRRSKSLFADPRRNL